jgi:hypothetical protein
MTTQLAATTIPAMPFFVSLKRCWGGSAGKGFHPSWESKRLSLGFVQIMESMFFVLFESSCRSLYLENSYKNPQKGAKKFRKNNRGAGAHRSDESHNNKSIPGTKSATKNILTIIVCPRISL